jgi:predicted DNA-binding transcriptional regulator YafY
MKRKTLPLLALVATTLFLSACDDRSDDLKAISKFKDLTPPRSAMWSAARMMSAKNGHRLTTHPVSPCRSYVPASRPMAAGGSYYYLVDMQEKTVQPLMNALCIADNIKLEYQEVTDPYTKEKYFEYAHDGKLMGRLLIPSNPENQE